jgi:hypothetical protein
MTKIERADIERRLAQVRSQIAVAEASPTQENAMLLELLHRPQESELQAILARDSGQL